MSRLTSAATRNAEFDAVSQGVAREALGAPATAQRMVYYLGSEAARERIWLQCDAVFDAAAAVVASWAMLESLTGARVSAHRHLVLGRVRLAVALPATPDGHAGAPGPVPFLDAGAAGATPAVLDALQRFLPTMIVQFQDWSSGSTGSLPPAAMAATPAISAPASDTGGAPGRFRGLRQIESYRIPPDLHARLDGSTGGWAPGRWGRRVRLGWGASLLDSLPEAVVGAATRRYITQMGFAPPAIEGPGRSTAALGAGGVLQVAPGRYVPRPPWRRLGGGNIAELALARFGAFGLTGQVATGMVTERAGQALAMAEGAVLRRLNLLHAAGGAS